MRITALGSDIDSIKLYACDDCLVDRVYVGGTNAVVNGSKRTFPALALPLQVTVIVFAVDV